MKTVNNKIITINLNEISQIKEFADVVKYYPSDIDLLRDRLVLDAKSIIGLLSVVDLSQPIDVRINTNIEAEEIQFENAMKAFQ